jgi:hypothetical protein
MQKTPPRYVPTLTQVIPASQRQAVAASTAVSHVPDAAQQDAVQGLGLNSSLSSALSAEQITQQLRQQLLVRTRQYIDIELQRRIRETVSLLALEHAHKLFEELQPQLESTVRQVVEEALAQAVAHAASNAP